MGWREDRRVTDNSRLTSEVVALTLGRGYSVDWRGYWRRMTLWTLCWKATVSF